MRPFLYDRVHEVLQILMMLGGILGVPVEDPKKRERYETAPR